MILGAMIPIGLFAFQQVRDSRIASMIGAFFLYGRYSPKPF